MDDRINAEDAYAIAKAYCTRFDYGGAPHDKTNGHYMFDVTSTANELMNGQHSHLIDIYLAGKANAVTDKPERQ